MITIRFAVRWLIALAVTTVAVVMEIHLIEDAGARALTVLGTLGVFWGVAHALRTAYRNEQEVARFSRRFGSMRGRSW